MISHRLIEGDQDRGAATAYSGFGRPYMGMQPVILARRPVDGSGCARDTLFRWPNPSAALAYRNDGGSSSRAF